MKPKRQQAQDAAAPGRRWTVEDTIRITGEAQAAAADLRAAKREANEATADLRQALKDVREQLPKLAEQTVEDLLKRHADTAMATMAAEIKQAVGRVRDDVRAQLDDLLETYLAGEQGEPDLPTLVASRQALRRAQQAVEHDRATSGGQL